MRILFIAPYIPSHIRVRPYNFLHVLAQRGHDITLVVLQPPGEPDESLNQLREWCKAVHVIPLSRNQILKNGVLGVFSSLPLQAAYSRSPEFNRFIADLLAREQFDVAHVEHLRGAVLAEALGDLPVLFDSVDSIALLFEKVLKSAPTPKSRLMAMLDLARTRRFEGELTKRFPAVIVTSAADRQALIELGSAAERITVVPNGVDLDYFQPMNVERDPLRLVFTGKMSYHANVAAAQDLVEKIMPLVWQQQPNAHLQIVGKDPSPVIRLLGEHPNITVTGFVPDMRPYLAEAAVAVSTVRYGVGIQNKVLEAMAMATPVVCSPQACSALSTQQGRDLLAGETPEAIAQHILDLLSQPEKRAALGAAGRQYVEQHQTWQGAAQLLEAIYENIGLNRKQPLTM
jgi:sugar transferase (PEP-CTERM/EpsH1 system associated)